MAENGLVTMGVEDIQTKKQSVSSFNLRFLPATINDLPREILVHVFMFYVNSEGVTRIITHLSKVNAMWENAAKDLKLWETVDDPYLDRCNLLASRKQLSLTRKLNLSYLKSLTIEDMMLILPRCPKLQILNIKGKGYHDSKSTKLLPKLPEFCPNMEHITISSFYVTESAFSPLLNICGPKVKHLKFFDVSFSQFSVTMTKIAECCPLLEELHLLHNPEGRNRIFPVETFQNLCPKLRILQLGEVTFPNSCNPGPGFPALEIFVCDVVHCSGPRDSELTRILHASSKLRVLNLNGNKYVTSASFAVLPCESLETLYLSRCEITNRCLPCVIIKWKHSLQNLDLSMSRNESTLNETLLELIHGGYNLTLKQLNLAATPISVSLLTKILQTCPELTYLNVEQCRSLNRGTKRIYHSYEEIVALRRTMNLCCFEDFSAVKIERDEH